jgi:hypothetical protein
MRATGAIENGLSGFTKASACSGGNVNRRLSAGNDASSTVKTDETACCSSHSRK